MGKKAREYKSGDFIFAKVKGYPAWPARVQKLNGKKYFVYFYGTGETANLPPNMIFDYAENKDKFLTKTVKRRDFNDGVKQIEHDFANNVPLAEVIGAVIDQTPADSSANDTASDSIANDTADETMADTTVADDSVADESSADTTAAQPTAEPPVEDSDEAGALVIDEGNKQQKGRKSKVEAKTVKETPVKAKEPKTPRSKGKKEEVKKEESKKEEAKEDEEEKKEEEIVSRSGRKIRPKRYIDEQTEDNATLPSPAPKKRRGASPSLEKEKEKIETSKEKAAEKNNKHYNTVTQSELEELKEPFKQVFTTVKIVDSSSQKQLSSASAKTIPKFIKKQKNTQKNTKKTSSKPKKFVPPVKSLINISKNESLNTNINSVSEVTIDKDNYSQLTFPTNEIQDVCANIVPTCPSAFADSSLTYERNINEYHLTNTPTHRQQYDQCILLETKKTKSPKDLLGGVISGSLNLLYSDETPANLSQNNSELFINLSQSRNASFCSVASLQKTYKDLDLKSFEAKTDERDPIVEKHKIPEGDDLSNLFRRRRNNTEKPTPMSTELGDIGFNVKYSDYMKSFPFPNEEFGGCKQTYYKILQMYPIENNMLINMSDNA